jgi:hypothetical protein
MGIFLYCKNYCGIVLEKIYEVGFCIGFHATIIGEFEEPRNKILERVMGVAPNISSTQNGK